MTYTTVAAEYHFTKQLKFYSISSIQFMQLSARNITKRHNVIQTTQLDSHSKSLKLILVHPIDTMTKVAQITPATRYQSVPALLAVITVTEFPQIQNWDDRKKFRSGTLYGLTNGFGNISGYFVPEIKRHLVSVSFP